MPTEQSNCTPAPLLRRLAALFYDLFLLIAVLFFASALAVAINQAPIPKQNLGFQLYLLLVTYIFFAWFWTHGGETLGMRAWRLQLQSSQGGAITWRISLIRFMAAIPSLLFFGCGYWWVLIDPKKRSWHDRLSHSQLCLLEKKQRS
ncbi:MAG: RDD family protein [Gammaproteobacteria bacterium]|nr:RDD family protein [Gammaproteobacteria bacterium]